MASVEALHKSQVSLLEQRLAAMTESEAAMSAAHEAALRDLEAKHAEAREEDRKHHEASSESIVAAHLAEARSRSQVEVAEAVEAHGALLSEQHHASLRGRLQRQAEEHEAELARTRSQHEAAIDALAQDY